MRAMTGKNRCRMYGGSEGIVCVSGRRHSMKTLAVAAAILAAVSSMVVACQSGRTMHSVQEQMSAQTMDILVGLQDEMV